MYITVYEVLLAYDFSDTVSMGLYFRGRAAIKKAKELAKQHKFDKIESTLQKHAWGEADEFGLIRGVYITVRKIEE